MNITQRKQKKKPPLEKRIKEDRVTEVGAAGVSIEMLSDEPLQRSLNGH